MCQARALAALHIGLEPRRFAIAIGGHTQAQALGVLRQDQDVGVTAVAGHWVGLGQSGTARGRHGGRKSFLDETAPALAQFAAGGLHTLGIQKVFWRFAQAAAGCEWVHVYINKD